MTVQIIDNADPEFSMVGTWSLGNTSTADKAAYGGSIRYDETGTGTEKAIWTFSGLAPGTYQVAATWSAHSNRATNSPFTIKDGSTPLGTVRVSQELAPNDFTDEGVGWKVLGEYTISGTSLVVELTDDADEYVVADAIRIESLSAPPKSPHYYTKLLAG